MRVLWIRELEDRVGVTRSTIDRWEREPWVGSRRRSTSGFSHCPGLLVGTSTNLSI